MTTLVKRHRLVTLLLSQSRAAHLVNGIVSPASSGLRGATRLGLNVNLAA